VLGNLTKALSVACLLFFCNNVNAEFKDWNKTDKILFGTYVGLNVIDVGQTFDIIECQQINPNCDYIEKNPIIGSFPSKEKVVLYKTLTTGIVYYALEKTPDKNRTATLLIINGIMLGTVVNNYNIGLSFTLRF
jgi:hypothetical protein